MTHRVATEQHPFVFVFELSVEVAGKVGEK